MLPGCRLNEDHPFGGGGQRIPTLAHRYRSGVARFAGKTAVQAAGAVDGLHHAERQLRLLKARPLLNVQLEIAGDIRRRTRRRRLAQDQVRPVPSPAPR